jgi:DNA helicase-2/ATP-dependent DNA helicase PcrA
VEVAVDLVSNLNPMQRQAVLHGDGPLLILAGAGSGKTRTLTHRVAHLIGERAVPASHILAVTFTNKAAGEMRERLVRILGDGAVPWVSTFHSTCVRILRIEAERLGFGKNFVIYDDRDQERLLKECLHDLHIPEQQLAPRLVASLIDGAKNKGWSPQAYARNEQAESTVHRVYALYQRKLRLANALDFGDLLLATVELFEQHADVLDRYRGRFRHVLVDEYQDTNAVQYRLTNLLASAHRNLCVVGDDDQSIYRWRGAEIANILDFERDYPDATVIRLEQNYRSTGNILDAAGAVVACNRLRKGKKLWTDNPRGERIGVAVLEDDLEEGRFVVSLLRGARAAGRSWRDMAVFYRTNAQSRVLEETLVRDGVPYEVIGGVKFFARAEVKDVLAYLRILVNPADSLSAKRIVNVPARGLGATTVERIAALEEECGGFLAACRAALERELLRPGAAERLGAFLDLIDSFRQRLDRVPYAKLAAAVIEESGYGAMLREANDGESRERLQNLEELLKGMEEHAATEQTLQDYLEQIALVTDVDSWDDGADRVTLMTLHAAKGLEFPIAVIAGMEEGLFPLSRGGESDIEEERRLCYVGMTRAMKRLVLTHARRRRTYGDFKYNERSRFLDEVPPELLENLSPVRRAPLSSGRAPSYGSSPYGAPSFTAPTPSRADGGEMVWDDEDERVRIVYDGDEGPRVGSKVRHASFGVGTIKSLEGSGAQQKVVVIFRSVGAKKLLLRSAGLQPV